MFHVPLLDCITVELIRPDYIITGRIMSMKKTRVYLRRLEEQQRVSVHHQQYPDHIQQYRGNRSFNHRPELSTTPSSVSDSISSTLEAEDEEANEDEEVNEDEEIVKIKKTVPVSNILHVLPSHHPKRPATIIFPYPSSNVQLNNDTEDLRYAIPPTYAHRVISIPIQRLESEAEAGEERESSISIPAPLYITHWERNCVKNAFHAAGFQRKPPKVEENPTSTTVTWQAGWIKHVSLPRYATLRPHQKINHFPDSWVIGRKDRLMALFRTMRRQSGGHGNNSVVDFVPQGFQLPGERQACLRASAQDPAALWILKPPASACGRGIRVLDYQAVQTTVVTKPRIIQRYIADPYLLDGRKFDLRMYVVVTSMNPLRVHLAKHGLVRLCAAKYSTADLKNRYGHLTNYSINRHHKDFVENEQVRSSSLSADDHHLESTNDDNQETDFDVNDDDDDFNQAQAQDKSHQSNKWSLQMLWEILGKEATDRILIQIKDIVVKTMIAAEAHICPILHQHVPYPENCYELYGFDFMFDQALKVWLIEVNISPSLMGNSALDKKIKGCLMSDTFNLVGFQYIKPTAAAKKKKKKQKSKQIAKQHQHQEKQNRLKYANSSRLREIEQMNWDKQGLTCLSDYDWNLLYDFEEELERCEGTQFQCIYPHIHTVESYTKIFTCKKYANVLIEKWLKYKTKHGLQSPPIPKPSLTSTRSKSKSKSIPQTHPLGSASSTNIPGNTRGLQTTTKIATSCSFSLLPKRRARSKTRIAPRQ